VRAAAADGLLSIGEVLEILQTDFADVSVSKIRFLESEDLITPVRTSSGYRKFSHADVERLRYILQAQRDRYLPLKVIRSELDAMDRGLEPVAGEGPQLRVPRALVAAAEDPESAGAQQLQLTREELCRESGISDDLLQRIEQYDLVAVNDRGFYDVYALRICSGAHELTEYGIEPRHLRSFKVAADREIGLVGAVVTPYLRRRTPDSASRGHDLARELTSVVLRLHSSLVHRGLAEHLDG